MPDKLQHFAINCDNVERAKQFYETVFDWTFQPWGPPGFFNTADAGAMGAIQSRRELVPGSLQVHSMKGYGAVEIGVHRFYHPKSNTPTGEGRFIQLWRYKDGTWKMTRVISFDHHQAAK